MSPARIASLTALVCLLYAQQAAASVLTPPIVVPDEQVITASPKPGQAPVFRGRSTGAPVDWSLTEEELKQRPTEVQPLSAPTAPEPVQAKPAAAPAKPAPVQAPAPPPNSMTPTAPVLAPPQLTPPPVPKP